MRAMLVMFLAGAVAPVAAVEIDGRLEILGGLCFSIRHQVSPGSLHSGALTWGTPSSIFTFHPLVSM